MTGFTVQPDSVATSHYVGVLAPANAALRDRRQRDPARGDARWHARAHLPEVGRLERRPGRRSTHACSPDEPIAPITGPGFEDAAARGSQWSIAHGVPAGAAARLGRHPRAVVPRRWRSPSLLGVSIASGRVYGSAALRAVLTGYVELMRGTPLLLQLFVLYYGIAAAIRLPAFGAAALGLALELRRLRERDLSQRPRGGPARTARSGAHAGLHRASGADAHPRTAGVPAGAGADDQRLRGAARRTPRWSRSSP